MDTILILQLYTLIALVILVIYFIRMNEMLTKELRLLEKPKDEPAAPSDLGVCEVAKHDVQKEIAADLPGAPSAWSQLEEMARRDAAWPYKVPIVIKELAQPCARCNGGGVTFQRAGHRESICAVCDGTGEVP